MCDIIPTQSDVAISDGFGGYRRDESCADARTAKLPRKA